MEYTTSQFPELGLSYSASLSLSFQLSDPINFKLSYRKFLLTESQLYTAPFHIHKNTSILLLLLSTFITSFLIFKTFVIYLTYVRYRFKFIFFRMTVYLFQCYSSKVLHHLSKRPVFCVCVEETTQLVVLFPSSEQINFNKQPLKFIFLRLIICEKKCNIYFITNLLHQSNSASILKSLASVFCSEEAVIRRLEWGKTKLLLISQLMKITGSLWILMIPDLP